jgi:hypothetical protein
MIGVKEEADEDSEGGLLKREKSLKARLRPDDALLFEQDGKREYFLVDEINRDERIIRGIYYDGKRVKITFSLDDLAVRNPLVAYFQEIKKRDHLRFLKPEDVLRFSDGEREYLFVEGVRKEKVSGRCLGSSGKLRKVSMSFDELISQELWGASFQEILAEY